MSAEVIVAVPSVSNSTVIFWVITVGARLSLTVTTAVADALFPFSSVTVNETMFSPILEQLKDVLSNP